MWSGRNSFAAPSLDEERHQLGTALGARHLNVAFAAVDLGTLRHAAAATVVNGDRRAATVEGTITKLFCHLPKAVKSGAANRLGSARIADTEARCDAGNQMVGFVRAETSENRSGSAFQLLDSRNVSSFLDFFTHICANPEMKVLAF